MAQRQEAEAAVLGAELEALVEGAELRGEVGVGEHGALAVARGPRGVDDGGEVLELRRGQAGLDLGRALGRGAGEEVGERRGARTGEARRRVERDERGRDRLEGHRLVVLLLSADEDELRAGVEEDLFRLLARVRRVDGHADGAGHQHAEVGDGPVGAVGREDRHPVSGRDAGADQGARHGLDARCELGVGDGAPILGVAVAHRLPWAEARRRFPDQA